MIVALIAVAGIWDVRAALEATFREKLTRPSGLCTPSRRGSRSSSTCASHLQWFITLLGAMVALATLAKGALRQAFLATGGIAAEFPPEYVLLQGAYFTGLLALVYIPTYTILAAAGPASSSLYPVSRPTWTGKTCPAGRRTARAWRRSCNCVPGRSTTCGQASRSCHRSPRASSPFCWASDTRWGFWK